METIDEYANTVCIVVKAKDFPKLGEIMSLIFSSERRIQILSTLTGRIPGSALEALLLVNLPHLSKLGDDEYREWFESACTCGIAIYDLARFFLTHGKVFDDATA